VLLGRGLIRNWVTLLVMQQMDDSPQEVVKLALARARFCQLMAEENSLDGSRYFLFGLLSLLDVFMGQSIEDALSGVAVSEDLYEELTMRSGEGGRMLMLLENFETGGYNGSGELQELEMGKLHQSAVLWSEEMAGLLS
jgi:EAL and modified HD-GYP domain-containing signal transduction protein